MSDAGRQGPVSQAIGAAASIATSLPPAFLGLLFINVIFIGLIFLLLDRAAQHRADMIDHILAACTATLEHVK